MIGVKIPIGRKFLIIGLSNPRFRGWRIERGPFKCWNLRMGALRIGWELKRWH